MEVDDLNITLASGAANAAAANGAGITVDGASATITYDGTNDEWDFNKDINVTGTVTSDGLEVGDMPSSINGVLGVRSDSNSHAIAIYEPVGANENWSLGVDADGDLGFYNSGSTTAAITFSDTNNVGIGTTSPSNILHISASAPIIRLTDTDTSAYGLVSASATDGSLILEADAGNTVANSDMIFRVDGSEGMRIDSSGNVGIGTDSPSSLLHVAKTSGTDVDIARFSGASSAFNIKCSDLSASTPTWTLRTFSGETLAFGEGLNESARFDGSGNFLVATTSTTLYNGTSGTGFAYRAGNELTVARSGASVATFVRQTSDGDILSFKKDGTLVGSIGAHGSSRLYIVNGDTGLRLSDAEDDIRPTNAGGTDRDAAIDLGDSAARFKDLYLSGTITAGGLTINTSASQYLQWNNTAATVLSYYVGSTSITASTTTDIVTFNGGANHYAAYDLTIYSNDSAAPAGLELTRMTILVQTNASSVTRSAMTIVDQTSTYASGTGNLAFSVSASGTDLILTVTESDGDARGLRVFVNSEFWSANRYGGATII